MFHVERTHAAGNQRGRVQAGGGAAATSGGGRPTPTTAATPESEGRRQSRCTKRRSEVTAKRRASGERGEAKAAGAACRPRCLLEEGAAFRPRWLLEGKPKATPMRARNENARRPAPRLHPPPLVT